MKGHVSLCAMGHIWDGEAAHDLLGSQKLRDALAKDLCDLLRGDIREVHE